MNQTALVEQLRKTPDLIGEIIKVVKRNNDLETEVKTFQNAERASREQSNFFENELRCVRTGMQSLKNEHDKAISELETARADRDIARALHRDLKFDYDRATETLDAVRSDRDVYVASYREAQTNRGELEQAKEQVAKYENAIHAYQKAETRLRERLVEQSNALDKLRNQVNFNAPSESEWKAKELKLASYEEQFRQLKAELGKKNATLDQVSSNALSANAINSGKNDTADELVNLKLVNAALREENRERANTILQRDYEIRGLKAKSEHDEATIAKLKAKLEKTKTELAKRSDPDEYESSLVDELIVLRVANGELKAKLAKIEEVGARFLQLL